MTLLVDKIREDLLAARRAADSLKTKFLSTLLGEVAIIGKDNGDRKSSDEETRSVVKKFMDSNRFSLGKEIPDNYRAILGMEQEYLQTLMPTTLTEAELRSIITGYITQMGKPTVGVVMSFLKAHYPNRYDGSTTVQLVKTLV